MGHRLSRIVTRTGDNGTTGLGDGSRVAKNSVRIDAIGSVDELNSTIGLLLAGGNGGKPVRLHAGRADGLLGRVRHRMGEWLRDFF